MLVAAPANLAKCVYRLTNTCLASCSLQMALSHLRPPPAALGHLVLLRTPVSSPAPGRLLSAAASTPGASCLPDPEPRLSSPPGWDHANSSPPVLTAATLLLGPVWIPLPAGTSQPPGSQRRPPTPLPSPPGWPLQGSSAHLRHSTGPPDHWLPERSCQSCPGGQQLCPLKEGQPQSEAPLPDRPLFGMSMPPTQSLPLSCD